MLAHWINPPCCLHKGQCGVCNGAAQTVKHLIGWKITSSTVVRIMTNIAQYVDVVGVRVNH